MVAKMNKTAMLVIDMQVAGGQAIIPNVIKAVEVARESGILVVWVVREHDPMGRDVELYRMPMYGEGKESPVSLGNVGSELVEGLEIKKGDYKLVKTRFSAFFGTNLHSFLQRVGINSLVVTGVQTPNCVRQTVIEALELDYDPITVITDASAAATPEVHAANLYDMKKVGIATPTLKEWCKSIA
ncbi:probable inactive nicotinamidase At3g16190 isoform X2 [Macadamia integrifolia]|uniref:probable inactive nicotinamidase At3g16190 isoform X2 n=1 Tax=Macadamia integrifolia TaxID=60698 RepID=UPI001C4F3701|nr:probable inactive nicotinamidase At3g16190 isoform X2 [Macadamia integrifolia]